MNITGWSRHIVIFSPNEQKISNKKYICNSTQKSSHDKLFKLTACPFQYGVAFLYSIHLIKFNITQQRVLLC